VEETTDEIIVIDPEPKPRKKQTGLTVLTCAAMFGILIYMFVAFFEDC
jgi:hypothetical protein